jgi:hypothetical protein
MANGLRRGESMRSRAEGSDERCDPNPLGEWVQRDKVTPASR